MITRVNFGEEGRGARSPDEQLSESSASKIGGQITSGEKTGLSNGLGSNINGGKSIAAALVPTERSVRPIVVHDSVTDH